MVRFDRKVTIGENCAEGEAVGVGLEAVVGRAVGAADGNTVGNALGTAVGTAVGTCDTASEMFLPAVRVPTRTVKLLTLHNKQYTQTTLCSPHSSMFTYTGSFWM
jgi:hypothetical protein